MTSIGLMNSHYTRLQHWAIIYESALGTYLCRTPQRDLMVTMFVDYMNANPTWLNEIIAESRIPLSPEVGKDLDSIMESELKPPLSDYNFLTGLADLDVILAVTNPIRYCVTSKSNGEIIYTLKPEVIFAERCLAHFMQQNPLNLETCQRSHYQVCHTLLALRSLICSLSHHLPNITLTTNITLRSSYDTQKKLRGMLAWRRRAEAMHLWPTVDTAITSLHLTLKETLFIITNRKLELASEIIHSLPPRAGIFLPSGLIERGALLRLKKEVEQETYCGTASLDSSELEAAVVSMRNMTLPLSQLEGVSQRHTDRSEPKPDSETDSESTGEAFSESNEKISLSFVHAGSNFLSLLRLYELKVITVLSLAIFNRYFATPQPKGPSTPRRSSSWML